MRKGKKITVGVFVALLALVAGACGFFRVRQAGDMTQHSVMASEFPEIWRALALRRFGLGDSAEDLIQQCPPKKTEKFGGYAIYQYYAGDLPMSGISVIAREGKLISARAGGCTLNYTFFETVDSEIDKQYQDYVTEKRKGFALRQRDRYATNLVSFHQKLDRWPTNELEFATFVTGLRGIGTNFLRIILKEGAGGTMEIANEEFPEEKRVAFPAR